MKLSKYMSIIKAARKEELEIVGVGFAIQSCLAYQKICYENGKEDIYHNFERALHAVLKCRKDESLDLSEVILETTDVVMEPFCYGAGNLAVASYQSKFGGRDYSAEIVNYIEGELSEFCAEEEGTLPFDQNINIPEKIRRQLLLHKVFLEGGIGKDEYFLRCNEFFFPPLSATSDQSDLN